MQATIHQECTSVGFKPEVLTMMGTGMIKL